MKIAVVGSRNITVKNMEKYLSKGDEIVSGGAKGVDACAEEYAKRSGCKLTVFFASIRALRSSGAYFAE